MADILRLFQAFAAPAIFVSAEGLLLLSLNVRLMGMVTRLRAYLHDKHPAAKEGRIDESEGGRRFKIHGRVHISRTWPDDALSLAVANLLIEENSLCYFAHGFSPLPAFPLKHEVSFLFADPQFALHDALGALDNLARFQPRGEL